MTITVVTPDEGGATAAKPDLLPTHLGLRRGAAGSSTTKCSRHLQSGSSYCSRRGAMRTPPRRGARLIFRPPSPCAIARSDHPRLWHVQRREAPQFYPDVERPGAGAERPQRAAAQ